MDPKTNTNQLLVTVKPGYWSSVESQSRGTADTSVVVGVVAFTAVPHETVFDRVARLELHADVADVAVSWRVLCNVSSPVSVSKPDHCRKIVLLVCGQRLKTVECPSFVSVRPLSVPSSDSCSNVQMVCPRVGGSGVDLQHPVPHIVIIIIIFISIPCIPELKTKYRN